MRRRAILLLTALLLALCLPLSGCAEQSARQLEIAYVLITKSSNNPYFTYAASGFRDGVSESGGKAVVLEPDKATAEEQISLIRSCIRAGAKAIAIAANDTTALETVLQEAMDRGIQVSTLDSNSTPDSHAVFVNQVSSQMLAQCLMDAVYELSGGEGAQAILSTTNQAGNQNSWIKDMQAIMPQEPYRNLRLVDIAFGEDNAELSKTRVEAILEAHPDLKVLCVPTVVGMRAAAEVLAESGSDVKLTGLGMPSEMADYMTGADPLCPVMYLWDPGAMGKLSAYVSMALTDGTITGAPGEVLVTPEGTRYEIVESAMGGSEIIVGEPQKFTPENIGQWKDVF